MQNNANPDGATAPAESSGDVIDHERYTFQRNTIFSILGDLREFVNAHTVDPKYLGEEKLDRLEANTVSDLYENLVTFMVDTQGHDRAEYEP